MPGTDLGARFRIGTVENEVNTANGLASDGEVEDYMVQVKPLDFGDLNDLTAGSGTGDYQTTYSNDGPRHGLPLIPTNAQIFLGGGVDAEADGQPDINAGATGNGDGADEDGVIIPSMFFRGEQADFTISVTTNTTAYIYGYIDWNNDGLFTGPEEVQNTSTATSGNVMLTFNVPLNAIINTDLGARFRIGSVEDEVDQANGFAMDGEVEDYLIKIKGLDFGDLPVA